MKYFLKNKLLFILFIILATISALSGVLLAFIMKLIVNSATKGNIDYLYKLILITFFYIILEASLNFLYKASKTILIKNCIINLKNDLFSNIISKSIFDFNSKNSGEYISMLNNDISIYEEDFFNNICIFYYDLCAFIFSVISMIILNKVLALIIFVLGSIPILIPIILGEKIAFYKEQYSNSNNTYNIFIKDIFSGFEVVKSFNINKKILLTHKEQNKYVEKSKSNSTIFNYFVQSLSYGLGTMMYLSTLLFGAYLVLTNRFSLGLMIAVTQLMVYIASPIQSISSVITKLKSSKAINNKFKKIMLHSIRSIQYNNFINFNNNISFKNVNFYYENKLVINNINLSLFKGKKYYIVGESGSGKSTLVKLLMNFYDNYTGSIEIDGVDVKSLSYNNINELISLCNQNVFMFDDTIKNNIMLYKDYPIGELDKSIKYSALENIIKNSDNGINSKLGENGSKFSGGEKQRIAIARTLIKNTPIIIFDEATSSLDNETSDFIERSLLNLNKITSITITHKLNKNTLKHCDKIIVMKEGSLKELGTFDELIIKRGYFYNLYNIGK